MYFCHHRVQVLLCVLAALACTSHTHELILDPQSSLDKLYTKYSENETVNLFRLDALLSNLWKPEKQCFTAQNISNGSLSKAEFQNILPTIVYSLDEHVCLSANSDSCDGDHPSNIIPRHNWKVWCASIGALLVISFAGLIVVALVPLMPRKIYNVVTQFLIALSVGSLVGDAFLHLIPHALLHDGHTGGHGHSHDSPKSGQINQHDSLVWKSAIVLLGIYGFFITERLTIICQNRAFKHKKKQMRQPHPLDEEAKILPSSKMLAGSLSEKSGGSTSKLGNLAIVEPPSCGMSTRNSCANRLGGEDDNRGRGASSTGNQICNRPPSRPMDNARCSEFLKNTHEERVVNEKEFSPVMTSDLNTCVSWGIGECAGDLSPDDPNYPDHLKTSAGLTGIKRASKHTHHHHAPRTTPYRKKPHGHHHGHSHDLSSVKAIAWTIIAGDGLHNFCDGIAIGASFSEGLQGGLSTSLAVLCHELPHELALLLTIALFEFQNMTNVDGEQSVPSSTIDFIYSHRKLPMTDKLILLVPQLPFDGDFAVLLHAGMSVKAALFYNTLSSILCAAGTVLGVLLGSLPSVNAWLFLITAGMFVYIALVDMMPELSTNRLGGFRRCHLPSILFLWQNLGMIIGVAIMLAIAKFEALV